MYTHALTVMPSDTACTGEIKIRALLNHLQNIAGLAVAPLEGSPGELMERGYAWVLLQYDLNIVKRLPGMDEPFEVKTWHTTGDGFHTLRAFEVDSLLPAGEPLVRAKTSWVLIDLAASRPVRADRHLPEVFSDASLPVDPGFRSIPKIRPETPAHEAIFPVRFHDLDANSHVNNAVYFEWAYEATPLNLQEYGIREMCAEFRVSAKFGDSVRVEVRELPPAPGAAKPREFVYAMWNAAEAENTKAKKPMARFYCAWEPLGNGRESS